MEQSYSTSNISLLGCPTIYYALEAIMELQNNNIDFCTLLSNIHNQYLDVVIVDSLNIASWAFRDVSEFSVFGDTIIFNLFKIKLLENKDLSETEKDYLYQNFVTYGYYMYELANGGTIESDADKYHITKLFCTIMSIIVSKPPVFIIVHRTTCDTLSFENDSNKFISCYKLDIGYNSEPLYKEVDDIMVGLLLLLCKRYNSLTNIGILSSDSYKWANNYYICQCNLVIQTNNFNETIGNVIEQNRVTFNFKKNNCTINYNTPVGYRTSIITFDRIN